MEKLEKEVVNPQKKTRTTQNKKRDEEIGVGVVLVHQNHQTMTIPQYNNASRYQKEEELLGIRLDSRGDRNQSKVKRIHLVPEEYEPRNLKK